MACSCARLSTLRRAVGISVRIHKMLWGRSGNRCAFTGCGQPLSADGATGSVVIGEEAHIVAREPDGPRGRSTLAQEERDSLSNLILLCPTHHTIVDADPVTYTVERLIEMKKVHEQRYIASEDPHAKQTRLIDETYAGYVDEWAERAGLDSWEGWASPLVVADGPMLANDRLRELNDLRRWLFGRVWPSGYDDLRNAFVNFRLVLDDLISHFYEHADDHNTDVWRTTRFYKIDRWDPRLYDRLLTAYKEHVALVENLTYELTRAGNLICDRVRESLDPRFRLSEGALLITSGMYDDLSYRTFRVEYGTEERATAQPYPGLAAFVKLGSKRDHWVKASDI